MSLQGCIYDVSQEVLITPGGPPKNPTGQCKLIAAMRVPSLWGTLQALPWVARAPAILPAHVPKGKAPASRLRLVDSF